jgi:plasmid replication initiation protein
MGSDQRDLFDSPLRGKVRGERSVMEFPFFALTKVAQRKPIQYQLENVTIEVQPGAKGVATIYDKEVLLYIASLMAEKIESGDTVAQDFTFTAHDFIRVTDGNHSMRSYQALAAALERLQGTQIRTNIEAGGRGYEGWFSWLTEAHTFYDRDRRGEKRMQKVTVRLCDWLYRAILKDRRILTYCQDYFKLGPIERRLYELARSHCEDGEGYSTEIDLLRQKVGCADTVDKFRAKLRVIAENDDLPEYALTLRDEEKKQEGPKRRGRKELNTIVTFTPRQSPQPRLAFLAPLQAA